MVRNTEKAFQWVVNILRGSGIPFVITGGFAANLYGSARELADIDFVIPQGSIEKIATEIMPYVVFGPAQYKDEAWDLYMATLNYEGQEIDLCENETTLFYNRKLGKWSFLSTDFENVEIHEVYGLSVPVISKKNLIDRKQRLGREVDLEDVKQLS